MSFKKKRLGGFFLLMITGLLFMSCEEMFTTNIFQDLDKLDLSSMSSKEKAVTVLDDAEGAIEDMSEAEVDDLIAELEGLYNNPGEDDDTRMQAAAAAADVELAESGANDTINNLGDAVSELADGSLEVDDPSDILTSIFSDESGNPLGVTEIAAQLEAMVAAAAALEVYGSVLGADGGEPAYVNPEEIAMTALIVGMVDLVSDSNPAATYTDIANVIANPDSAADDDADGIPNLFESLPDMSNLADDPAGTLFPSSPGMQNIVNNSSLVDILGTFNS